jgi:DNA helicase IV
MAQEIALEQTHADVLYARVDELLAQVEQSLAQVQGSQHASTHQNRSERDAFMTMYEDRLSLLRTVAHNVVFGRLDTDQGERRYIGRIGLFTAEREQLLVDWRAPAAAAYYQATSRNRMEVRLRRHLITQDRTVVGLEDDVLDRRVLDGDEGLALQGEGALLAAVSEQRTGRMGDIVSTIQAEQDRIIRSEHRGVQVVQGGPGTGKTAVALHRAAYLLYTHRRRLEHTGVLIVAPTTGFLRYIERVLPSLGESGVVMLTPGTLYPGIETDLHDVDRTAQVKGDTAMSSLLRRAVSQRQLVPEADVTLSIDGTPLNLSRSIVSRARKEARAGGRQHNAARAVFTRVVLEALVQQYQDALQTSGNVVVPEDRPQLLADLRSDPTVRRTLNLAWMPYSPESFLRILLSHPERLRAAAPRQFSPADLDALARPKDRPWTIEDIPLLDELAELLGQDDAAAQAEAARRTRARDADVDYAREVLENVDESGIVRAEDLADRAARPTDARTLAERAGGDRGWTYGHVVVDEAQELSPMMWRALMRRCPAKSFTVVGDVAQTSSAAGAGSWQAALGPYVEDRLEVDELSVNYRTPRRIMNAAERVAEAMDLPITPVRSVREGEHPVRILRAADPGRAVVDLAADRVTDMAGEHTGRLAVIAPGAMVGALAETLRTRPGLGRIGTGSAGVDQEVAVMTASDAKGLEFDGVVVVEPAALSEAGHRGAGDLYVAMTRPTQRLEIVHHQDLPAGLED